MDTGFSSYHNGGPAREQDFGRLSQTIGTSILKVSQNGKLLDQLESSNQLDRKDWNLFISLIPSQCLPCKRWLISWVAPPILKNLGISCKLQNVRWYESTVYLF